MSKKKIIYSIILVILISFILLIFNAFNGNPISKFVGKKVAAKYLEETYPNEEFRLESGEYNFKFSEYNYPVYKIGEDPFAYVESSNGEDKEKELQSMNYSISVTGFLRPRVRYDEIRSARRDEILCKTLSYQASLEIEELLKSEIPNLVNVWGSVEVIKGQLPSDTSWSKDIILDEPIYIDITLDSSNETAEDCVNTCIKIQQILAENNYNYSGVNINGNGFDKDLGDKDEYGYVKYALSFGMDDEILLKDVKEVNQHLK